MAKEQTNLRALRRTGRVRHERSAGGLVLKADRSSYVGLLIGRNSPRIWSLPKGHVEPDESIEQAAVREVKEETGIDASIVAGLSDIRYWFYSNRTKHSKVVHFYLMRYLGGSDTPQLAEVDETAWVPFDELPKILTHLNERKLIDIARDIVFADDADLGLA
ncbi:MAG: NUDIX hydrolase [Candidatus Eremiobacteraeota bacterium]|nr:NUDIX hydrolase [Candidatus Eremiobacteraeota bacterium]